MRLFVPLLLVFMLAIGCQSKKPNLAFEATKVSHGFINMGDQSYDWYSHEWNASDGTKIDVELISFTSKLEAQNYFLDLDGQTSKDSKEYDGRKVTKVTDSLTTGESVSITLWRNHKIITIKAPNLNHASAFEECCSKNEFKSFQ